MIQRKALIFIAILFALILRPDVSLAQEESSNLINYEPLKSTQKDEDGWRPLSEEEIVDRKRELAFELVTMAAELMDSLYLSYLSEGIINARDMGKKVIEYNNWLKDRFSVEVDVDFPNESFLIYRKKF